MRRLAERFELFAPDLRGFGASDKPTGTFGPQQQADDLAALIPSLGLSRRSASSPTMWEPPWRKCSHGSIPS